MKKYLSVIVISIVFSLLAINNTSAFTPPLPQTQNLPSDWRTQLETRFAFYSYNDDYTAIMTTPSDTNMIIFAVADLGNTVNIPNGIVHNISTNDYWLNYTTCNEGAGATMWYYRSTNMYFHETCHNGFTNNLDSIYMVKNGRYTDWNTNGTFTPTGTPSYNYEPVAPKIPLDYGINFKYQNALISFKADYLSKTTTPVSDLPDPTYIYWELVDRNLPDCPLDTFNRGMNLNGTYNTDTNTNCHEAGTTSTGLDTIICRAYLPVGTPFTEKNCLVWGQAIPFKTAELKRQQYTLYASLGNEIESDIYIINERYSAFIVDFSKSAQTGNTENCEPGAIGQNETVHCTDPGIYKTCDILDVKCNLENFVAFLMDMISILFIPDFSDNPFEQFTTNSHGLASVIISPVATIATITNGQCTPLSLPLPFVNQPLTLPCMSSLYLTHFGAFFVMYQVITTGIISYYVLVNMLIHVKNFKSPKRDQIEVFKL